MRKPYAVNEHHTKINFATETKSINDFADANWVTKLVKLYDRQPIHLRRLHYFALACKTITKPDGQPYSNTIDDYDFLINACLQARYLNLLAHESFAIANLAYVPERLSICRHLPYKHQWQNGFKQKIEQFCQSYTRTLIAAIAPVHLEIWLENSTAIDLLLPLVNKYNIDLIGCENEIPLTTVLHFIRHISLAKRPAHILHLSDLTCRKKIVTPPAQVKLNSLMDQYCLSKRLDISFEHLLLTPAQKEHFNLPYQPQPRYIAHKERNEYVVELNSLEAIRPGHIVKILDRRIEKYLNHSEIAEVTGNILPLLIQLTLPANSPPDKSSEITTVIDTITQELSAQANQQSSHTAKHNRASMHPKP